MMAGALLGCVVDFQRPVRRGETFLDAYGCVPSRGSSREEVMRV